MNEKQGLSQGVEILFTLFFGQPKKVEKELCYDFFSYFFYNWVLKDKKIPDENETRGIYGEFLWRDVVVSVLEGEKYFFLTKNDEYHGLLKEFRIDVMKKLTYEIDPLYDEDPFSDSLITMNDVSEFLQKVAKNRIWGDLVIKQMEPVVKELVSHIQKENIQAKFDDITTTSIIEQEWKGVDWFNPEIYYTDAFEKLEKENWKRFVAEEYHEFIDRVNLTEFKKHLKDNLGHSFCPLGWQGEFLVKHSRFNFIAASRRSGKTFLGAGYLCGRQLLLPGQNVVYIVPTLKNHAEPAWQDLEIYFKEFPEMSFDKNKYLIKNTQTGSTIKFYTSERKHAVRGAAAHLLVCDEMAFVPEVVYETASALVATTNGMVYGISTVNPDVPKNYFYYNLLKAEVEAMVDHSEYYGRRVTLDENPFIPEKEKSRIKNGARNIDLFNAEWMAVFMDKDSFNLQNFWIMDESPVELIIDGRRKTYRRAEALEHSVKKYYEKFIISHDGAKRKDKPGITVYGIRGGEMHTVMAGYAEGFEYWDQVDLIVEISRLLGGLSTVDIVIDYGGAGVAVEEIFRKKKNVYPICVQTVGDMFEGKDGFIFRVGKELMKNRLRAGLDLGAIKGFSFMNQLRLEFEGFSDENENKRLDGNHFDMIKSMFQAYRWAEKSGYLEKEKKNVVQDRLEGDFDWNETNPFTLEEPVEFERISKFGY